MFEKRQDETLLEHQKRTAPRPQRVRTLVSSSDCSPAKGQNRKSRTFCSLHFREHAHGLSGNPASRKALAPVPGRRCSLREQPTTLTNCVMDVADCSTDIAHATTPCGATTEQHYI